MDAKKVSIFSMVAASSCCLPPLILLGLTLIGVGTAGIVGLSSTLGSLKWYFLPLGIAGVGLSYWLYFREKKKCSSASCRMANEKLTKTMLMISTVVVFGFFAWSIYPYFTESLHFPKTIDSVSPNFAVYTIEGMTCGGCEIAVNQSILATGIVDSVKSDFMTSEACVWFKKADGSVAIAKAVASVGYNIKNVTKEQDDENRNSGI
mgnify:CR=1 FL=1